MSRHPRKPNRNNSRHSATLAAVTPWIKSDHLPRKLVCALYAHAPMLLATEHETLYASALISVSLSKADKANFLDRGPTLSQFQADELAEVFESERREFGLLSETEGPLIARLQALALWDGLELARERLGFGPALRNAWLRRTMRLAARQCEVAQWLSRQWPNPRDWAAQGTLVRRVYREALPHHHPAWQARDDDAALNEAALVRCREEVAEQARRDSHLGKLPSAKARTNTRKSAASGSL